MRGLLRNLKKKIIFYNFIVLFLYIFLALLLIKSENKSFTNFILILGIMAIIVFQFKVQNLIFQTLYIFIRRKNNPNKKLNLDCLENPKNNIFLIEILLTISFAVLCFYYSNILYLVIRNENYLILNLIVLGILAISIFVLIGFIQYFYIRYFANTIKMDEKSVKRSFYIITIGYFFIVNIISILGSIFSINITELISFLIFLMLSIIWVFIMVYFQSNKKEIAIKSKDLIIFPKKKRNSTKYVIKNQK